MLQKATSSGYSWWWASHIRTKQSRWLELNLQDMDAKVDHVLNLIQKDGDSFARRAEMYYRHRPDVINFVEETLRAYRALAQRYDQLSTHLQNANTTIASICPEKVNYDLDDEDFNDGPFKLPKNIEGPSKTPRTPRTPRTPKPPTKDVNCVLDNASKTIEETKMTKENPSDDVQKSGFTKDDALEEIDNLQKQILEMQAMKDTMMNYYENSLAEFWDAETRIMENQQLICSLEDEFDVGKTIEEDAAGTLMAEEALKSCEETLAMLQEKQRKFGYDVSLEHRRFDEAKRKLKSLKLKCNPDQTDNEQEQDVGNVSNQDHQQSFDGVSKNPQKVKELAETIDKLVNMAITLENSVSSQNVLTDMLRKEADDLQAQIRNMEDSVSSQTAVTDMLRKEADDLQAQIRNMEDSVSSQTVLTDMLRKEADDLKAQLRNMEDSVSSQTILTDMFRKEADDLKAQLRNMEDSVSSQTVLTDMFRKEADDLKAQLRNKEDLVSSQTVLIDMFRKEADDLKAQLRNKEDLVSSQNVLTNMLRKEADGLKAQLRNTEDSLSSQTVLTDMLREEADGLKAQLQNMEDSVSSQNVLTDILKKEADDLKAQIQNMEDNLPKRDHTCVCNGKNGVPEFELPEKNNDISWQAMLLTGMDDKYKFLIEEYIMILRNYKDTKKRLTEEQKINKGLKQKLKLVQETLGKDKVDIEEDEVVSPIEEKLRMDIDAILDENLDFWLRFSTGFHEVHKFKTQVEDLQEEIYKVKAKGLAGKSSTSLFTTDIRSEIKPIYKHLKDINNKLATWLQQGMLMKKEIQMRSSSLTNIQEEIKGEEMKFSTNQAAKFQGEIMNMKQEHNNFIKELEAGLEHVVALKHEIEKTLERLKRDFGLSTNQNQQPHKGKSSSGRSIIPLRSFLFGVNSKKQRSSLFSCLSHPKKSRSHKSGCMFI